MAIDTSGLAPDEQRAFDSLYGSETKPAAPPNPGFFTGALRGVEGVPAALGQLGVQAGQVASTFADLYDPESIGDGTAEGWSQSRAQSDAGFRRAQTATADYFRPDPSTTGWVGQTLYGIADVGTRFAAGAALGGPAVGAAIAGSSEADSRRLELINQGVDPDTATKSGLVEGGAVAAGSFIPVVGKTLVQKVLSGAIANTVFGMGSRAADSAVLNSAGYHTQAEQQKWNDGTSIIADAVLGAAFGLAPHEGIRTSADEVDSALTAKNAANVTDLAPGVPADPASSAKHVDALDTAINQTLDGQPVQVDHIIDGSTFVSRPDDSPDLANMIRDGLEEGGAPRGAFMDDGTPSAWTPTEAAGIIDNRLSALDDLAKGVRSSDDVRALVKESGDLEDLVRQQYANRDAGIVSAPENTLGQDELAFAENRIQEIKSELEAHRQAVSAQTKVSELRRKLGNIDTDPELVKLANAMHPANAHVTPDIRKPLNAGDALYQRLRKNQDILFSKYAGIPESEGGRILNTDTARELSPEYRADRTKSSEVHEAASEVVKRLYSEKLAHPTPAGHDPVVMFTAGGTGAGKTSGLKAIGDSAGRPEIIYDTNMNTLSSSQQKVRQALDAGRDVRIVYVYRDPVEALTGGAIPRAERQAKRLGSGRTVPLSEHARTHAGVRNVMEVLAEKYRDDPRVQILAVDNSRGKGRQEIADLATLPRVEENQLHERLAQALEEARKNGLAEDLYQGFRSRGRSARGPMEGDRRADSGEASAERDQAGLSRADVENAQNATDASPAARAGEATSGAGAEGQGSAAGNGEAVSRDGEDPYGDGALARARQAVAEDPDRQLADGVSAADMLRAADEEVIEAERTGAGIRAAISCFLQYGSEV